MKKNKKIMMMCKIFFICFFCFTNISIAFFEYKNPDGGQTNICGYTNSFECTSDLLSQCPKNTNLTCVYTKTSCPESIPAQAQVVCPPPETETPVVLSPNTPPSSDDGTYTLLAPLGEFQVAPKNIGDYFNVIFNLAIGLCAVLAVIMIVLGGVQYMGDESIFGKTEAKSKITSAVAGLIIALGSYALLNTINPDLLGKKGVTIEPVSVQLNRTSGGGYFGVDIGTPGSPNANKNIVTYDTELKAAAQKYGLECTLIKAFMYAESGGVNGKTSPAGAGGLIQLMPATFKEQGYEISKIMDPLTNIMAGASYISKLKKNGCNGSSKSSVCDISNIQYLAASYNGGPGANKESPDCSGSTLWRCTKYAGYKETRTYAPRVEANFNKLKEKGWGC